jgi:hypothetical protein
MRVVPTFTLSGWVKTPEERIDRIILYYTNTNPSQTLRYNGHVVSLQSAIFRAGDSMDQLARIVAKDLTFVFTNNFPEGATVTVEAHAIDDSGRHNLEIEVVVTDNGKQYNAAQTLTRIDSDYVKYRRVEVLRG